MTNRLLIFSVALAASMYVFSGELSAAGSTTSSSATYGGTLIVGITSDVDSFNPLFGETSSAQEITHMFLLGLADLNDKSEFAPELANSWESSDDYPLDILRHPLARAGHGFIHQKIPGKFDIGGGDRYAVGPDRVFSEVVG